jgi:hypothetical protein
MQDNRYCSTEYSCSIHEIPMHGVKDGVWCTLIGSRIMVPVIDADTLNSESYMTQAASSQLLLLCGDDVLLSLHLSEWDKWQLLQ